MKTLGKDQTSTRNEAPSSQRPLTREQRRRNERVGKDAQAAYKKLCDALLAFMMESEDPEGEKMLNQKELISAKWKLYCNLKKLVPESLKLIDKFYDDAIRVYKEGKA